MRVGALCKDIILEEKNLLKSGVYGNENLKVAKIREERGIGSLMKNSTEQCRTEQYSGGQ
jgi:hypothetical protein